MKDLALFLAGAAAEAAPALALEARVRAAAAVEAWRTTR